MRDFPGMSRDSDIDDWTFTQILGALPDTPAVIRAYLMGGYGVLVGRFGRFNRVAPEVPQAVQSQLPTSG